MKKSFAFDYRVVFFILITALVGLFTRGTIIEKNIGMSILGSFLTLLFVFGVIIVPKLYIADEEGISIYYLPFIKEYFKWSEIKRIKLIESRGSSRSLLLDFLWKEYEIIPIKEKIYKGSKYHSIFHNSEIFKSPLAVKMIKKYWDGNIEDDSFLWLKKYFRKADTQHVKYDLTEVKQKEKQARDYLREIVSQYENKAAAFGKTIDASFTYFTDENDFDSRPKGNYSYDAEIFVEKENDDEKSFYIRIEFFFVCYGKNKLKITENKKALAEAEKQINEAIEK